MEYKIEDTMPLFKFPSTPYEVIRGETAPHRMFLVL